MNHTKVVRTYMHSPIPLRSSSILNTAMIYELKRDLKKAIKNATIDLASMYTCIFVDIRLFIGNKLCKELVLAHVKKYDRVD